jgi:gamma-glutamyltranspeptidase
MKRTSKYLFKTFGNWTCTHVGISHVQAKKTNKGKVSKQPGRQTYYYIFERKTSDGLAEKLVRLSAGQAAKVYRGELSVEAVADVRQEKGVSTFKDKVSYHFIGK